MPRYLSAGAVVLALWVAIRSGEVWTGTFPAALVVLLAIVSYVHWERHGRPWHDWAVILTLLPAILASVWIGVGGLLLDVARTEDQRLLYEVGPGIGLVGLLCTLIAYHGRHHPDEPGL
jgi:purine-cytosine permease-like protein